MNTTLRWPVAPLLGVASCPSIEALAALLGVSSRTISRWHHAGLSDRQADHAAIALGLHPATIWPAWFNAAA